MRMAMRRSVLGHKYVVVTFSGNYPVRKVLPSCADNVSVTTTRHTLRPNMYGLVFVVIPSRFFWTK